MRRRTIGGTYCLATEVHDGGTCIGREHPGARIVAGIVGADRPHGGDRFLLVADPGVRTIRFSDPGGEIVERGVGSSGFFLAAMPAAETPRPRSRGTGGRRSRAWGATDASSSPPVITLAVARETSVCVRTAPHAP